MTEDTDIDDNTRSVQELETYNIIKTREDIENEFKNLKFLHQHEEKDNVDTIFNETRLNGSFENTYVLRQKDDTFIFFPHDVYIVKNLKDFWSFYDSNKDTINILIDSRLINYIAFGVIKYGEDLMMNLEIFNNINSALFINDIFYKYNTNSNSVTQSRDRNKWLKNLQDAVDVYMSLFYYIKIWHMDTIDNIMKVEKRVKKEISVVIELLK